MSFQAYLTTIENTTGKSIDELVAEGAAKGLSGPDVKAADVVSWLADGYGLGRGHSMALYKLIKEKGAPKASADDKIDVVFKGAKAQWRPVFDELLARLADAGLEVSLAPTSTYVSLLKGKGKIGIVQPTAARLDIGIKRKGAEATARFAEAGTWNAMVTHRVGLAAPSDLDDEVIAWLVAAYEAA